MNHLSLIIKREYLNKVRNKSFIIMTFLSPLIFVGIFALVGYLSSINNATIRDISIVDESGVLAKNFKDTQTEKYTVLKNVSIDDAKLLGVDGTVYGVLHIPKTTTLEGLATATTFYSKESPSLTIMRDIENTIESQVNTARLKQANIDADKIKEAASVKDEQDLYQAQCDIFLDPHDQEIIKQAKKDGVPDSWITAAQNSPVYKMAMEWKVALPLHPEYRTLPMVWYIPPLSPITNAAEKGQIEMDGVIPDVHKLRIPVKYLANLLTAGKEEPVVSALEKMIAMREYMREKNVEGFDNPELLKQVGLDEAMLTDMYRIMALANYEDRFVIPTNHREYSGATPFDNEIAFDTRSSCGFSFGNGCSGDVGKTSLFGTKTHKNTMSGKVPKTSKKSRLGKFGSCS